VFNFNFGEALRAKTEYGAGLLRGEFYSASGAGQR